jgi:gliding motility-associated-like protein
MVQLPLVIKTLNFDTISHVAWTPTEFLGYYDHGSFSPLTYNTFTINPYYLAQDQEMVKSYEVTVYNGPKGKGCETSAEISINNYIPVNIPNIFSPNGDGLNDYWILRGLAKYPKTTVKVFNRWGNILFENHDGYKQPWDGTSAGAKVPFGTYYYVVEFLGSEDQSDYSASGWVVVME